MAIRASPHSLKHSRRQVSRSTAELYERGISRSIAPPEWMGYSACRRVFRLSWRANRRRHRRRLSRLFGSKDEDCAQSAIKTNGDGKSASSTRCRTPSRHAVSAHACGCAQAVDACVANADQKNTRAREFPWWTPTDGCCPSRDRRSAEGRSKTAELKAVTAHTGSAQPRTCSERGEHSKSTRTEFIGDFPQPERFPDLHRQRVVGRDRSRRRHRHQETSARSSCHQSGFATQRSRAPLTWLDFRC